MRTLKLSLISLIPDILLNDDFDFNPLFEKIINNDKNAIGIAKTSTSLMKKK